MKKEALLVIDMLNDFVLPGAPLEVPGTRAIISTIRHEIDRARAAGHRIPAAICRCIHGELLEFRCCLFVGLRIG